MSIATRIGRPLSVVARGYERFFRHIHVDEAWVRAVRGAAKRGSVVYVLRNVSLLDLLALDYLTRRFGLPRVGFANELASWVSPLSTMGARPAGPGSAPIPPARPRPEPLQELRETVLTGGSAVLFLKRAPTVIARAGATHRGRREGDDPLQVLLDLQRGELGAGDLAGAPPRGREIMMVPQTFVWTQRPERRGFSIVDTLFGPAEFPGDLRAAAQFLLNYKNCVLRAGEPLSLRDFLQGGAGSTSAEDATLIPRLTYALLRKVERERRAVVGPAHKPADRVREEVLRSPKLQAILRDTAGPGEAERAELTEKARGMLRALQAAPDPQTLKGLEVLIDALVDRLFAGIEVDLPGIEEVRKAAGRGSIVLLPSHKSHVDYMLLAYVLRKNALSLPVVAAGDNLAFFPVGGLFRRAGAFFIRRNFKGDRLYTAVVDAYIRRLIRDGWPIEFFLEGGRSRTGKLRAPQLGLLNMVVDAALSLEGKTITFVPVSIGYERMMEDSSFARELSGQRKEKEDAAALLKLTAVLRETYGCANVQFGAPIELAGLAASVGVGSPPISPAKRRALVTRLANQVMSEINRVTAVTPGSLVATVLLCRGRGPSSRGARWDRGIAHAALVDHCARLTALVRRLGARTTPSLTRRSGVMREQAIRDAALLYVRGGIVHQEVQDAALVGKARKRARIYSGDDVIYSVPDDKRMVLDLSKNVIVHLFVDRALISAAMTSLAAAAPGEVGSGRGGADVGLADLREQVQALSRLFKLEFRFRADAAFDRIFEETLGAMVAAGELSRQGHAIGLGQGHSGMSGREWIAFYASVVANFLEGYRVAARALRALVRGPLAEEDVVARAIRAGEQMLADGEIERHEAVSQPVIENAITAFIEQGWVRRAAGVIALDAALEPDASARAVEARIARYLPENAGEIA
jgi:glycerol-3-phosphate O-acyltransferase